MSRILHRLAAESPISLLLWGVLFLAGCAERPQGLLLGYAEGEFVQISSPQGGSLETLKVKRGTMVRTGDPLFILDSAPEAQEVQEMEQALRRTEKNLNDLLKGERPTELAALAARLEQARTRRNLSRQELERRENLFREQTISAEALDQARAAFEREQAAVRELEAEQATSRLGAREDRIAAARADVSAAQARLEQARWRLAQKSRTAPAPGLVFDTLYEEGEYVPPGSPVVTLLPPEGIKIRFFVPEPVLGSVKPGQNVTVSFDGAEHPHKAHISFISPEAEYTPPIIYSRQSRAKLVFLVEARPEDPAAFHPGQPVEVRLEESHGR